MTPGQKRIVKQAFSIMESAAQSYEEQWFNSPSHATEYVSMWFGHRQPLNEIMLGCYLTTRHQLIETRVLATGTIDGASVYPREVVRAAVELNAAAVVLAHNHPSGISKPSAADERLTHRLRDALGLIDVTVLDHLIYAGPDNIASLAERGLL